jgi:hypothetical protein
LGCIVERIDLDAPQEQDTSRLALRQSSLGGREKIERYALTVWVFALLHICEANGDLPITRPAQGSLDNIICGGKTNDIVCFSIVARE